MQPPPAANKAPSSIGSERLELKDGLEFCPPAKCINDGNDLNFFLSSTAYRDLTLWLLQLNRSMFPTKDDTGRITPATLNSPPTPSTNILRLQRILDDLSDLVNKAPPSTGPRRFGNVAFREWYSLAGDAATDLLESHLSDVLRKQSGGKPERQAALINELEEYLLGSFGSAQRLDYGTGHELSFIAFLGCLWKLGTFEDGEERAIVVCLIQPYLELMRKLIMTYTLEPAGSHGVWGLDDHSFVPYIFGAAQLGPAIDPANTSLSVPTEGSLPSAPSPSSVAKKDTVSDYKDSNMYFSAIQFIYDVKRGPFWEHSPVLYDVSGIKDGWGKINKGMLKMYAAEVLGKFPVVQHFPFGSLFRWEQDPNAAQQASSIHAQQQPPISKDAARPPVSGAGTAVPWAVLPTNTAASAMPSMQSSTGVPTARAPSAGSTKRPPPPPPDLGPTAAPWASMPRPLPPPPSGPTAAPLAVATQKRPPPQQGLR